MVKCLLFGVGIFGGLLLVAQLPRLFKSKQQISHYKHALFSLYIGAVLWLTLLQRWGLEVSRVRFEPFYVLRFILNCKFGWKKTSAYACSAAMRNSKNLLNAVQATPIEDLLLNIILFIPFGFLLPFLWPKLNIWKTTFIGILFSVCIESTQYIFQLGCCDIDDIINNTFGTFAGYVLYWLCVKFSFVSKSH